MNIERDSSVTFFQRDGSSRSALRAVASSVHFSKSVRERPSWSKKKSLTELYAEEEAKADPGK
ncbi:MAG: hypothetical protein EBZ67_16250 [Chitinophagia bacterium]|nr:hypothetical protein [Chitinophagia bacterium]